MKKALVFNYNGLAYVLVDGANHRFQQLVRGTQADEVVLFDDHKHAIGYADAMINRGLWNDTGIYRHVWELYGDYGIEIRRVVSTSEFANKVVSNANSARYREFVKVFDDSNVVLNDDVGFLNINNYTTIDVSLRFA